MARRWPGPGSYTIRKSIHVVSALHRGRDEILAAWGDAAGSPEIADRRAELLDRVIDRAGEIAAERPRSAPETVLDELGRDVDVCQVTRDYATLREVIEDVLEQELTATAQALTLRPVHRAIDEEIAALVDRQARHQRESADRNSAALRLLAEATAARSSSSNEDETLDRIARLAVPLLADWCAVDVVEPNGAIRRVSVAHRDAANTELAREWASDPPTDLALSGVVARVIQRGQPELVDEASHGLGLRAHLTVPMIARERTLGAVTLVRASSGRAFHDPDVALASELARRAAIAVDNVRLRAGARDALRARDRLLAIVSHELRTPLGTIGIIASLLRKRHAGDERTNRQLEIVEGSVERMQRLISDLLDISSIEAGRLALALAPVEVTQLVDEAVASHGAIASARGISLAGTSATSARVHCDRARIEQVLANLLANSLGFCRPGDTIAVSVGLDGDRARFTVADSGPGIAAEDLTHVFEPFWSAKPHVHAGTGLGLAIGKGIIEAHGGEIRAASTPGRGTAVSFTLPLAPA